MRVRYTLENGVQIDPEWLVEMPNTVHGYFGQEALLRYSYSHNWHQQDVRRLSSTSSLVNDKRNQRSTVET